MLLKEMPPSVKLMIQNPLFTCLVKNEKIGKLQSLNSLEFKHIDKASRDYTDLESAQAKAVAAINDSSSPLVSIHGPPGTGKTHCIGQALKKRSEDARANNPRDLTLCLAMTNEAAVNMAATLFKMDVKYMRLCMGENTLALGKKDLEGLEMLKENKRVSNPNVKTKDIPQPVRFFIEKLQNSRIFVMTVCPILSFF